ncbi:MAG: hypothetical protein UR66_C0013G0025 [Candidatus Moranbacteria bacterium GW2011_GWE1_35_17]|nr:MAG: hypothetical protein UR66_C0013G0025 [Candidatus Moranbacteria bacterium GW2011_GWE1_35_17]KKP81278.1 MAG: hypothetical protein UR82_C0068G0003 [Candidatus Moranbacteria bacterium GW2011_GWF1_35_5]KKP82124.1 MAG: hypothetical protein UR83_C0057G0002 [Candidatus Moranbacteria bacterium GW2011_GWF2_35_54]
MQKKYLKIIIISIVFFIFPNFVMAATYYVRTDGGNSTQCTGLADAAYDGNGTGEACALNKFQYVTGVGNLLAKMTGGDTVIIGSGEHMIGYDPSNVFSGCSSAYPYSCVAKNIPAGTDADHPTRILGIGWDDGCSGVKAQLWGNERVWQMLKLGGDNIEVQCLEVTDHSSCIENGPIDGNIGLDPVHCQRSTYPFGSWAPTGISSAEGTSNILIKNVDIHGLASRGIMGYRNGDWILENVNIIANGFVGWDSDGTDDDSYTGTTFLDHTKIEWSGCGEIYPITTQDWSSSTDKHHCWSQTQGGFGDGIGLGDGDVGIWKIYDSSVSWNTSDGIDLLHGSGSTGRIEMVRSKAEGNAGQAFKSSAKEAYIENSIIIGNCGFHYHQSFTSTKNSTTGADASFDTCRANGDTVVFANKVAGQILSIVNSTILSNGDSAIISGGTNCDVDTKLSLSNSIVLGGRQFNDDTGVNSAGGNDTTGLYYASGATGNGDGVCGALTIGGDYNIIYNTKYGANQVPGTHSLYVDPNLAGIIKQGPYLTTGYYTNTSYAEQLFLNASNDLANPAIFLVDSTLDFSGSARGVLWDAGALEYASLIIRSDVDNSSATNTTDALLTLRNSLSLSMTSTAWQVSATTGDVNCDEVSNSTDALLILRYSLGLSMDGTSWCE